MMEKLLVRMPNWLGDSVMSVAALRPLSRRYELYLLGKPWLGELFYGEEFFKGIYPYRFLFTCTPIKNLGLLLTNSFSSALNFLLCGVRERIGYQKDGRGFLLTQKIKWTKEHQVLRYTRLAEFLLKESINPEVKLKPPVQEKEIDVVLVPGGSKSSRRWPASHFRRLGKMFREKRLSVLYVGSEKEKELLQQASDNLPFSTPDMLGLKEILARARLVLGNDTGPMHLADAMGTRVLVIFGPATDPEINAPWNQRENYIRTTNLSSLQPDQIFERALELL